MPLQINLSALHEALQTAANELNDATLTLVQAQNRRETALTNYSNASAQFHAGVENVIANTSATDMKADS